MVVGICLLIAAVITGTLTFHVREGGVKWLLATFVLVSGGYACLQYFGG